MNENLGALLGIANRASSVKLRNILTPLLWFSALCLPMGIAGLVLAPPSFAWVFVMMMVVPMIFVPGFYTFFALNDPKRLQSEEYLLQEEQLKLMSKTGEVTDPIELAPVDLDSPKLALSQGDKDE